MLHNAKIRVHPATKHLFILFCWFVSPRNQVLAFNGFMKITFGSVGNVNPVRFYYCPQILYPFGVTLEVDFIGMQH